MKVIYDPIKTYFYAVESEWNEDLLEFGRRMKSVYGVQNFGFINGMWRFSHADFLKLFIERFPKAEMDLRCQHDFIAVFKRYEEEELRSENSLLLKDKIESNITIDGLKGSLYGYQKVGVEFFVNNNGRAILADTMGCGKTAQTLAYILYSGIRRALIVSPASVKYGWESETQKWTNLTPLVIDDDFKKIKDPKEAVSVFNKANVVIFNYEQLEKYKEMIINSNFEIIVCDEFHYIKNHSAKRTKAATAISKKIPKVLLLSGTPLLNRPEELYTGLNILDGFNFYSYYDFTKRYCGGKQGRFGWEAKGATNIDELKSKIGKFFLRRTKDQVLKELPPKQFVDVKVELNSEMRFEYDLARDDFEEFMLKVKNKKINQEEGSEFMQTLARLNCLRQVTTKGKVDVAKEIIKQVIDSGEKILVFSVYNEPLETLSRYFSKESVMLTGKTNSKFRKDIINNFQKDDDIKVFLGGIKSAGVGITLTSASVVLFIDYSWVPADHAQAVDRVHRPGQKAQSITVYQLYANNTIDEYMKETLADKQELFNKLVENNAGDIDTSVNKEFIDGVVKKLNKKND